MKTQEFNTLVQKEKEGAKTSPAFFTYSQQKSEPYDEELSNEKTNYYKK
nr:hypothetical protein ['Planchonia careya' phytoplasma]